MQDEPGWSRSQTEQNVGALRSMLAARGLAARPIGNVYTRNQIINDDAPSANGLDWVGIEAYLDPPGSPDPAQNTEALRFYLNAAKARVPSSKNIVLVMMAYDRNGNWTNMQTLVELQYDTYTLAAASDPRVIAITMFSYGRQGGTHDHPELKVPHREIAKALFGPPPDTCPPPPPPPPGPPNPPTDLRADAQQFRVTLTWRDNSNNETEFRIQRMDNNSGSFNPIGSASANSTAFADNVPAVPSGRSATYSYRVKAVNSAGSSGFTNTVTVTLFGDLPGTLTLIAPTGCISSVRPTFSWNAAARSSNYYIAVTRNDVENFFINQPGLLGTSYPYPASTAALTAGVQYRWKVKACNNLGCGAWTPSTLFTPFCPPDPPALTAPVGCSSRRPTFTWSAVSGANSYYIAVTRVDIENFFINAPGVPGTSYAYPTTLADLSPGVQYRWKVKSCNNGACGAWSPSSVFTVCPPDPPSLTSPVGCISDVRPTFTWSASPRATNYSIAITRVDIENFFINTSGVAATSYRYPGSLSNLLSGVQYRWKVKACNGDGCGAWTASTVFTPNCRR